MKSLWGIILLVLFALNLSATPPAVIEAGRGLEAISKILSNFKKADPAGFKGLSALMATNGFGSARSVRGIMNIIKKNPGAYKYVSEDLKLSVIKDISSSSAAKVKRLSEVVERSILETGKAKNANFAELACQKDLSKMGDLKDLAKAMQGISNRKLQISRKSFALLFKKFKKNLDKDMVKKYKIKRPEDLKRVLNELFDLEIRAASEKLSDADLTKSEEISSLFKDLPIQISERIQADSFKDYMVMVNDKNGRDGATVYNNFYRAAVDVYLKSEFTEEQKAWLKKNNLDPAELDPEHPSLAYIAADRLMAGLYRNPQDWVSKIKTKAVASVDKMGALVKKAKVKAVQGYYKWIQNPEMLPQLYFCAGK